jgi:hypothetical protein
MQKRKGRRGVKRRLWKVLTNGLEITRDLFPNWIGDHDFELSDYIEFLDKVSSREDLLRGLRQLDPFVDDALASAEAMTDEEFPVFKAALVVERRIKFYLGDPDQLELDLPIELSPEQQMPESIMPEKFYPILLPTRFMQGQMTAKRCDTSLEVAMGRIYEFELTGH